MNLLLIEDDPMIHQSLTVALQDEFTLFHHYHATIPNLESIHLILLDIQLPDGNGLDLIQQIHEVSNIPIIMLSVLDDDTTITTGLDLGADDYIVKPFSIAILKSRIKSVLRRYYSINEPIVKYGDLLINTTNHSIYKENQLIELTPIEEKLFFLLFQAKGKILTRSFLLENIWDNLGNYVEDNTLSVSIGRLKSKIGKEYIRTKRNVGYYFSGENHE